MSDTDGGDEAEEEPNPFKTSGEESLTAGAGENPFCDDEEKTVSSVPDEFEPKFRSWGMDDGE